MFDKMAKNCMKFTKSTFWGSKQTLHTELNIGSTDKAKD